MRKKSRKIEVHRLTISGIGDGKNYGEFLAKIRKPIEDLKQLIMPKGDKSHALMETNIRNRRLRMRFLTFSEGYRPDILDTADFHILPNPLSPNQTGVSWTHVMGGFVGERYVLLIEKVLGGIYPSTIEGYLQWMIDHHFTVDQDNDNTAGEAGPVTVSLEPEAGEEFIARIDSLSRVTRATVRKVRPNPGWKDLDEALGVEGDASDAHRADVTMTSRRSKSLAKDRGIIATIKSLFVKKRLDYAAIEGERNGQTETFNTEKLVRYSRIRLEQDDNGQVKQEDVWNQLAQMMDDMD